MTDAQLIEWALDNGWRREQQRHGSIIWDIWTPHATTYSVSHGCMPPYLRAAIQADRRRKLNSERKKVKA